MIARRVIVALCVCLVLAACPSMLRAAEEPTAGEAEMRAGAEVEQLAEQAVEHPGGHGAVDTNPLEFRTDLALWTGVLFLALLGVLWAFAWGPITRALDQRERAIAGQIAAAEKSHEDAQEVLADYQRKLAAAKDEVRDILEQARRDAEQTSRQIVEAAQQEAQREHQRALADIDDATADALEGIAQRSADLAVGLAGKIVGSQLRASDHAGLVEQALADFVRQKTSDA